MGMALLGSVGAAVYHHKMSGVAVPGLPADAASAAHETVGGAAAVARSLPGTAGHALLTTARDAFTSGMHDAALAGAAILVLTAVFALRAMRNEPVLPAAPKKEKAAKKGKRAKESVTAEPEASVTAESEASEPVLV
jgi:DHA2 family multidrug resistance protein-like MFS transporter